ncbi:hypothetical protein Syun_001344 [Stephania yunnanensis]|uniref:Integrase catalytic domain-containing protein n=1 Tax=Stephania yunnanensis TaxID=152371 RepID=A0AAP0LJ77_9MAGN
MIKTQFVRSIKILRTDNALEYRDSMLLQFLKQQGTIVQRSCPYTSRQNGRAERKHRHILDSVRAQLLSASCPEKFWGEAALNCVFTINRLPTPVLQNVSPFERLYGTLPYYSHIRVFGCACFVLLNPLNIPSLNRVLVYVVSSGMAQNIRAIGVGILFLRDYASPPMSLFGKIQCSLPYPNSTVRYHVLNHFSLTPLSSFFHLLLQVCQMSSMIVLLFRHPSSKNRPRFSPVHALRPTSPVCTVSEPPPYLQDYHCFSVISSLHEPSSYREASSDPLWQQAMTKELSALEKTHTWDLVELPSDKTPIGCKWIYKIKTGSDGSIERYKARLVAKGYTQEYGIDYEETFAPVARLTLVRSLLAVASVRHWPLFQMDVKNAFLNGDLAEEVYMSPPPGYSHPPKQVCLLRRALYGLKQAPRAWFAKFSSIITQFGFQSSPHDSALFTRRMDKGMVLLLLYVDDMIITGDDSTGISDLQQYLKSHFEMKDLGNLSYFLGLEVNSTSDGYYLSQAKYASDLLSRSVITDTNIASTPLGTNVKPTPSDGTLLSDPTLYRQLVGSLVYLTVSRPDIAYAVHVVSQFMSAPRTASLHCRSSHPSICERYFISWTPLL